MKEELNLATCGREEDLVGYLYNELEPTSRAAFQSHISNCASCSSELAAFGDVRESVVAWRNQSLTGLLNAASPTVTVPAEKPSALAALREFFRLSPVWMKGAVAFASILLCVLAFLVVVRSPETAAPAVVNNSRTYSEQEMKAIVDRRVQEEMQRRQTVSNDNVVALQPTPVSDVPKSKAPPKRIRVVETVSAGQKLRRPLSKVERQELAADLRLINGDSDSELELLSDRLNQ
ncbi:MAG TPA: zf-HC2 domain-containing protein [Pyrinomonadaceae bacterium]|nr:zf-HC2 domain-containing protein [Pyrinomonadaceae bacterium]